MKHQDLEKTDDQVTIEDVRRAIVKFCKFVKMLDQLKLEQFGECMTAAGIKPQTQKTACRVSPRNAAAQHISAPMPKEFQTAEAKRVLDKLVVAGLLTEDYMPGCIKESRTGIVRVIKYREKAILAESISKEIWKENRWIIFEDYWKIDNMRSVFGRAMNMKAYGDIIHAINEALK